MRLTPVLLVGLLTPLTGCNIFYYAGRNLVNDPVMLADEHKLRGRLKAEAREAWQEVCRQHPARTFTAEFADGFKEGYVDYLDTGGTPQPPAVAPPRYRRSDYLSPDGHARVKDYLVGFKYGAEVAAATGQRQFLTVPVVVSEPAPEPPLAVNRAPGGGPGPAAAGPGSEGLAQPRAAGAGAGGGSGLPAGTLPGTTLPSPSFPGGTLPGGSGVPPGLSRPPLGPNPGAPGLPGQTPPPLGPSGGPIPGVNRVEAPAPPPAGGPVTPSAGTEPKPADPPAVVPAAPAPAGEPLAPLVLPAVPERPAPLPPAPEPPAPAAAAGDPK